MNKKVLVTAGNTRVMIDQVRNIGNIFEGRTGAEIAKEFAERECEVTLLTSHPDKVGSTGFELEILGLEIITYKTYDELLLSMEKLVKERQFDVIIHSAAVSDYLVEGIYAPGEIRVEGGRMFVELTKLDSSGKVGSDHSELWMKMTPTVKIVDQIREPWGFKGTLVKFKLQVGVSDAELLEIATKSMLHSEAEFIVANTLEDMGKRAYIISAVSSGPPLCVSRKELPERLYREVMK